MQLKDLTMSFGTEKLFENVNLTINESEHIGIVGVNGAGKTTLFKLIMKKLEPDHGKIILKNESRVLLLPQVTHTTKYLSLIRYEEPHKVSSSG